MFLHCPGANDTFGAEDIDLKVVGQCRLFHFGYPPLMARMYADGGAELTKLLQRVKAAGATTSLDMALPDPAGPSGKVNWPGILSAVLPHVDIFTPSVEELTFMFRRRTFDELASRAGGGHMLDHIDGELLCDLGNRCLEAGVAVVLIKCGQQGLYVRTAGAGRLERLGRCGVGDIRGWTNRELVQPSYKAERIVSTTGAGDCAIAGFLAAVLRGGGVEDALRYGSAVGAQNVRVADAVSGVESWRVTAAQVAARPAANDVTIPLARWRHDPACDQ
jgi:sugar/nucleoside kinase (ribokinase family)